MTININGSLSHTAENPKHALSLLSLININARVASSSHQNASEPVRKGVARSGEGMPPAQWACDPASFAMGCVVEKGRKLPEDRSLAEFHVIK